RTTTHPWTLADAGVRTGTTSSGTCHPVPGRGRTSCRSPYAAQGPLPPLTASPVDGHHGGSGNPPTGRRPRGTAKPARPPLAGTGGRKHPHPCAPCLDGGTHRPRWSDHSAELRGRTLGRLLGEPHRQQL